MYLTTEPPIYHDTKAAKYKFYIYVLMNAITFCLSAFVDSSDWLFSFLATEVKICPTVSPDS